MFLVMVLFCCFGLGCGVIRVGSWFWIWCWFGCWFCAWVGWWVLLRDAVDFVVADLRCCCGLAG